MRNFPFEAADGRVSVTEFDKSSENAVGIRVIHLIVGNSDDFFVKREIFFRKGISFRFFVIGIISRIGVIRFLITVGIGVIRLFRRRVGIDRL